jgi:hypothetical protein
MNTKMKSSGRHIRLGVILFYLFACTCGLLLAFSAGPLPAHTGDFGEPTCRDCHSSFALNSAGGALAINGVPAQYTPGQTYPITVTISRSGQRRWGFELSARVAGNAAQAGTLIVTDSTKTQIITQSGIQYIEHTQAGTQLGASQGTWTFNWQAPDTAVGSVRFSAAGNAANGDGTNQGDFIYTTTVTTDAAPPLDITALFAQVVVGGGYSTVFSLTNTGSDTLTGNLILTRADGTPLAATLSAPSGSGSGTQAFASSTALTIAPGGTRFVSAAAPSLSDPVTGWARVESSGGELSGVATFQLRDSAGLETVAGVLSSEADDVVTIPVNDDSAQSRFTGYALANPGSDPVQVSIFLIDENGIVTRTLGQAITLDPGKQVARFLFQDVNDPNFNFQGSVVLKSDTGSKFAAVALVQVKDPNVLFTAIPVIRGKSSGVGN